MRHADDAGVAGDTPRRFRGNAHPSPEDGLPGLGRVRKRGLVDVDDDLIAIGARSRVEVTFERALRDETQGIGFALPVAGLVLLRRFRGNVFLSSV